MHDDPSRLAFMRFRPLASSLATISLCFCERARHIPRELSVHPSGDAGLIDICVLNAPADRPYATVRPGTVQ